MTDVLKELGWDGIAGSLLDIAHLTPEDDVNEKMVDALKKHFSPWQRKIKRLEKRLLEKQQYEAEMLLQTGADIKYINHIHKKDAEALRED